MTVDDLGVAAAGYRTAGAGVRLRKALANRNHLAAGLMERRRQDMGQVAVILAAPPARMRSVPSTCCCVNRPPNGARRA